MKWCQSARQDHGACPGYDHPAGPWPTFRTLKIGSLGVCVGDILEPRTCSGSLRVTPNKTSASSVEPLGNPTPCVLAVAPSYLEWAGIGERDLPAPLYLHRLPLFRRVDVAE